MTLEQTMQAAITHHQAGQLAEAEVLYRQILAVQPDNADALHWLGIIASQLGKYAAAVELISRACALKPQNAQTHYDLGGTFYSLGQLNESIDCYQKAIALRPDFAEAYNNMGIAFSGEGRLEDAIACFQKALEVQPNYSGACNNLGNVYADTGRLDDAIHCFQKALQIQPDYAEAYNHLGKAYAGKGRLNEAIQCYQKALKLQPNYAKAYNNMGNALSSKGRLEESMECYRQAMILAPNEPLFHDNLIFALHFDPACDAALLSAEHRRWNQRHGESRRCFRQPPRNDPSPQRRLKIGYVSPDLREHPVGRFLLPVLENHDHDNFEINCYSDCAQPDFMTLRLRVCADRWRTTCGWSEERLAEQISADRIDILVDLALHTAGNRLPVFAREPAPLQVSFAGYPGTTGLDAIDYRLSDRFLEPPERADGSAETVIRLPDSFWLFAPLEDGPKVTPLPALDLGKITFGCLGKSSKINAQVLGLWARVLRQTPRSRLVLFAGEGSHQEQMRQMLLELGIAADQVEFVGRCSRLEYLALYQCIDVILDTFPYNGHNTSLDTLWMGVPVVSLVGQTAVGRGGLSILSNIGLPDLVAYTEDDYVHIAIALANNLPRLAELRATMRARMLASPLMDAPRFAKNMEEAYRTMWKNWCAERTGN